MDQTKLTFLHRKQAYLLNQSIRNIELIIQTEQNVTTSVTDFFRMTLPKTINFDP